MKSQKYKTQGKKGLFDEQFKVDRMKEIGNPLEAISKVIDFEMFRPSLEDLLNLKDKGQELNADSAYTGENQEKIIAKYKMINNVNEKGYRNKPLTEDQ